MSQEVRVKVKLKNVIASYPNVFKPKEAEDGKKPKYSCSFLIDKSDKETVQALKDGIAQLRKEAAVKWFKGNEAKIPSTFKNGLRDGEEKDSEEYEGRYFVNTSSSTRPGVVDRKGNTLTEDGEGAAEFYAGCKCHATVTLYLFEKDGNRGIAVGLNNIMKVGEGNRLAGKSSVNDDFADELSSAENEAEDDLLG